MCDAHDRHLSAFLASQLDFLFMQVADLSEYFEKSGVHCFFELALSVELWSLEFMQEAF